VSIKHRMRRALGVGLAGAMVLALMPAGAATAAGHSDVCANVPAQTDFQDQGSISSAFVEYIECMQAYGIAAGFPDGTYRPGLSVSRQQMALFIARFISQAEDGDTTIPPTAPSTYTDRMDATPEARAAIDWLTQRGVVQGFADNTYRPGANVTRAQMASFIAQAMEEVGADLDEGAGGNYPDVDDNATHSDNINKLTEAGVVQGFGDGTYRPGANVTRQQMSQFIILGAAELLEQDLWEGQYTEGAQPAGPVSLNQSSAAAGGTITGSVENPASIASVSVTGCGFSNQPVSVSGAGTFSLTIPAGQTPGACALQFNVLRTDGTSTQQTINFNVTATPQQNTAAPDLVSASANTATGVVTYTFDQNVTGITPAAENFAVYNAAGVRAQSTNVSVPASAPTTVIAQFTTGQATSATLAAVREGAVQDAAGRQNYAAGAPLGAQTQPAGITSRADLQSVSNARIEGGNIVADFRFDQVVTAAPGAAVNDFAIIANDGTVYGSLAVTAVSADNRTVSLSFAANPAIVPIGNIVRGAVQNEDAFGANSLVLQTQPRTAPPAYTTGVTADQTNRPDITNVAVAGTNTVAFTFDEAVNANPDRFNFWIYDATGALTQADSASRASTNTSVVNAVFPAGTVGNAVGAIVTPGAVTSVATGLANVQHETGLQNLQFTAGRTALPDLVRVDVAFNQFGANTVTYTFDQALPGGYTAPASDYRLIDANGALFTPSAAGTINTARTQVTFSVANGNAYTAAQAAAAVKGAVQDTTLAGAVPNQQADLTEGAVTVTRP
jgi:hypothetical protein